ncbi:helix-turn-helix domain-containing protein [Streptomyces yanii]|uniref:Helix-turn-helix domain-containing protein n=1 Tax=Streptomyces yanii TaxID=78510 RepID=A0ABV5R5K3_9ACTN
MRYAQGGGLSDAGRAARERVRLQAVERFEGGQKNREIADALWVSDRSVERWRWAWRERGEALNGTFKAELIEHQGPWRDFRRGRAGRLPVGRVVQR